MVGGNTAFRQIQASQDSGNSELWSRRVWVADQGLSGHGSHNNMAVAHTRPQCWPSAVALPAVADRAQGPIPP